MRKITSLFCGLLLSCIGAAAQTSTTVTTVDGLSNDKVYTLKTNRGNNVGYLLYDGTGAPDNVSSNWGSGPQTAFDATNAAFQWAIYKSAKTNNYYFYSVAGQKFIGSSTDGGSKAVALVSDITNEVEIRSSSVSDYPFVFSTNKWALNTAQTANCHGVVSWGDGYSQLSDAGNVYQITEVGTLSDDMKTAIETKVAAFENKVTVHFVYKIDGQTYKEADAEFQVGSAFSVPACAFVNILSHDFTGETVTEAATVNVTCEPNLPFTASESYDNATWYVLNNMSKTNHFWEYTTTNSNTKLLSNTTTFPKKDIAPDASLWCFVGNLLDGFKIYNKAAGADLTVTKGSIENFYTLAENATNNQFRIVPSNTNPGTICFTADGKNYLNDQNGGLKDYGIAESGSSFRLLAPTYVISNTAAGYLAATEVPEGYVGTNPAVNAVKAELKTAHDAVVKAPNDLTKGQALATVLNKVDDTQQVGIDPNKYYRIENLVRTDGAGNKKMIGLNAAGERTAASPAKTDVSTLWKFEECEENGVMGYKLYSPNKKAYLGTAAANALVDTYQSGGRYRLLDLGGAQFTLTDGHNSNIVIYGSGAIGNWSSAGKDGDGAWYIIPATDIEVALHEADGKYWATTYLPFGAKVADGHDITAYTATVTDGTDNSEKVLDLHAVDGIAAETGVILYGTGSTCMLNIDETATTEDKGALDGVLVANTSADNSAAFVLSNGTRGIGFYHPAANAGTDPATYTLAANKAYLASNAISSSVQALRFSFGDVTGITDIEAGKGNATDVYFDLSGRRVSAPAKGIYVKNGKKVFVK